MPRLWLDAQSHDWTLKAMTEAEPAVPRPKLRPVMASRMWPRPCKNQGQGQC